MSDDLPDTGAQAPRLRLDKWLWFARFFKTRSLAAAVVQTGKMRVDGALVAKSHATVRAGQVLTFVQGRHVRVVRIVALGSRRGPASEAQALYDDLAPPRLEDAMPKQLAPRLSGSGRPTKKQRRDTDRLREPD